MGLDINIHAKTKLNGTYDWDYNGRGTFGYFKDFMVSELNYEYGKDMPLNKKKINVMAKRILQEMPLFGEDEWAINCNCEMLGALLTCRNIIDNGGEATWECDW